MQVSRGPQPLLTDSQPGDGAAELFHREMLARGAVCCLPTPAMPCVWLLPLLVLLFLRLPLHWRDGVKQALGMPVAFGDRSPFTIWGTCWVFPRCLEMVPTAKSRGAQQTVLNHAHLKGQAWGKKKQKTTHHVSPAAKKYFPNPISMQ